MTEPNSRKEVEPPKFQIEEFNPGYTEQVKSVVHAVLFDLGLVGQEKLVEKPEEQNRDADLDEIPKIYCGKGKFWVAVSNGKVIGTVAIRDMGNKTAKLNRMFVLTNLHGAGVGQALINQALIHTRQQGFEEVLLNTDKVMQRAHHFYERNGFELTGVRENQSRDYRLDLRKPV